MKIKKTVSCGLGSANERGFTLIELAITILIAGIMVALLSSAVVGYLKRSQIKNTETKITDIKESINELKFYKETLIKKIT